jgi:hypothetical protein
MIDHDLPMDEYLAMPALNSGTAFKAITQSPAHARFCQLAPDDNCNASDIGTIAHRLLLEGHEENICLVEADDWRTKAARECRDATYAEGKTPLLAKNMDGVRAMVQAAHRFIESSEIADVFGTGVAEATIGWNDFGVECKARPDYLTEHFYISLKTTSGSAEPASFIRRQLGPLGYDFGLMFYERGLKANGINVRSRLLVVEQCPPYGCCLIDLARVREEVNRAKVQKAIQLWGQCLANDVFPGYSRQTYTAEMTQWEINEADDAGYLNLTTYA